MGQALSDFSSSFFVEAAHDEDERLFRQKSLIPSRGGRVPDENATCYALRQMPLVLGGGGEKWIKHYSSHQKILLVGEGDFSFSASLAVAFGSAFNMVATSLDSIAFLAVNYRKALDNIQNLRERGCTVGHGVDATKMASDSFFKGRSFDRIVFNFPHAGFSKRSEPRDSQIRQHQELVRLFLKNAKQMLGHGGEIHISHKSNGFHSHWNLDQLASGVGLRLIGKVQFSLLDYPGYNTKYGYGGDGNFNCTPSETYKFGR